MAFLKKTILAVMLPVLLLSGCGTGGQVPRPVSAEQAVSPADMEKVDGIPMDDRAAVIAENVVDVFSKPDIGSERITQALYNQPVTVLDESGGWARVAVVDGSRGWVRSRFLYKNVSSIYGSESDHRIVVTSKEKSIYSNLAGGYTIKDVAMGTEFLSFNSSGDAYEVYLPGNQTGWLRGSGIIHIALNEKVPVTKKEDFVATALKFKGTSYLLNGLSSMGMDSAGLVYICARINGVDLSKNIEGQYLAGRKVDPADVREGDLVFLQPDGAKTPSCVGICTGNGSYIYAGKLTGYVTISSLNENNLEGGIVGIRRIFTD